MPAHELQSVRPAYIALGRVRIAFPSIVANVSTLGHLPSHQHGTLWQRSQAAILLSTGVYHYH